MTTCSVCRAEARPEQRTCRECHAAGMRQTRAAQRDRLVRIESLLETLLAEGRKPAHKAPRHTEEERMHA